MLKFRCPSCQKGIAGKPELAGKRVACPHCKNAIVVPAMPNQANPAPSPAPMQQPAPVQNQPLPQQQPFPQQQPMPGQTMPGQQMPGQQFPGQAMPQQQAPMPMQQPMPQNPAPMQMPGQPAPMGATQAGGDPLFGGGDPLGDAIGMEQMGGQMPGMMPGGVPMQQPGMAPQPGQPAFPSFSQPGSAASKAKGKRGSKGLVIALAAGGGGLAVILLVVVLYFALGSSSSPSGAFLSLVSNFKSQRWGKVWDGLDSTTHQQASSILTMASMSPNPVTSGLNLSGKSDREKFVSILSKVASEKSMEFQRDVASARFEVVSEEINGDSATLEIKEVGSSRTSRITMVQEDGSWKFALTRGMPGGFGPQIPTPNVF